MLNSSLRRMPVRRPRRGEVVPHRPEVGRGAVRLRVRCRVSRQSAPQPGHLPVSVQREPTVVSAAGQEVRPQNLQVGAQERPVLSLVSSRCPSCSSVL